MEKDVILTQTGYEKLKATIEELETVKRREVAERIKAAREFGDISENSEYDDAKNEQALLETRILRLKEQLRGARVIDTNDIPKDVVSIGSKVKVKYVDDGETDNYEIVGSAEADPANNRLSNESPSARPCSATRRARSSRWPPRAGDQAPDHGIKAASAPQRSCPGTRLSARRRLRVAMSEAGDAERRSGGPPGQAGRGAVGRRRSVSDGFPTGAGAMCGSGTASWSRGRYRRTAAGGRTRNGPARPRQGPVPRPGRRQRAHAAARHGRRDARGTTRSASSTWAT